MRIPIFYDDSLSRAQVNVTWDIYSQHSLILRDYCMLPTRRMLILSQSSSLIYCFDADTFSKAIQAKRVFAFEAKKYVAVTVAGLNDIKSDSEFKDIWQEVNRKAAELNIDQPTLPRGEKHPSVLIRPM